MQSNKVILTCIYTDIIGWKMLKCSSKKPGWRYGELAECTKLNKLTSDPGAVTYLVTFGKLVDPSKSDY